MFFLFMCFNKCTIVFCRNIPLRSARRKSTINQDMLKPNDEDFLDTPGSTSPGNSITSINSLASLLKEKMQVSCFFYVFDVKFTKYNLKIT